MPRLTWDEVGTRMYETGVDRGVLYRHGADRYDTASAWMGLTAVTESPSGAEANKQFADNIEYLNLTSREEFGATIEAFAYPPEFGECDGSYEVAPGLRASQQPRKQFGFCYRSRIGNDQDERLGYKINIMYGAKAAPSEKARATVNDTPEAMGFSWEVSTTPEPVTVVDDIDATAFMTIDSTKVDPATLAALENILYGTVGHDARLPLPDELITMLGAGALTLVIPGNPTLTDAVDGEVTVPSTTGVIYRRTDTDEVVTGLVTVIDDPGGYVIIRAFPAEGYAIQPYADVEWTFYRNP